MPVFEFWCPDEACEVFHSKVERYLPHWSTPDPNCERCGTPTQRLLSVFNAPWTGELNRFDDPTKEKTINEVDGGHWAWRKNSTENSDGSPMRVLIKTHAEQVAYCKAEGLVLPDDVSDNFQVAADGQTFEKTGNLDWVGGGVKKSKPSFGGAW